ncbi:alpha-tocopherol transfer protein-like [Ctenocephalides felis]|uniref:alpha-tocopherol transfer protein-like n=1 Tax=Ctenocephalides felis TaxID=7515 RepID=UPI000E6E18BE|nr:alpha-tocopherol transfer protein-like [Ctenocephalides felis]
MTLVQPAGDMCVKIREELREPNDEEAVNRDLASVKEWLKLQPHLPKDMDDQRIKTFLRGCKFSLEKVKRKLDMYYTMRNAVPEFFADRDVNRPELKEVMDVVNMPPLPGLTPAGRRVVMMRGLDKDVMTPSVSAAMKLALMIGDIRLKEEQTGVAGDVYVLDASVATPGHFAKFTPGLVKKFLVCVQEAYPVKLKEVHVINTSPLVDTIVNFVKPFLKEKIRQRIHFHGNGEEGLQSLYKFIPQEMLPEEYGGKAGSLKDIHESWRQKMNEYGPWFKEQEASKPMRL